MKILGIESAALTASAAILADDIILAEYTVNHKKTHSQTLLPMIDEIVRMTELSLEELDAIAISGGPGSFTGLRIGSATAKGLGQALNKPLIHVPTLDAMAYRLYGSCGLVCPIMDAKRSQVYTGIYRFEKEEEGFSLVILQEGRAMAMDELLDRLDALLEERRAAGLPAIVTFLGDGIPVFAELIRRRLGASAVLAPALCSRQSASAVASLGACYFAQERVQSAAEHVPEYLRKSQAEREREARLGADAAKGTVE